MEGGRPTRKRQYHATSLGVSSSSRPVRQPQTPIFSCDPVSRGADPSCVLLDAMTALLMPVNQCADFRNHDEVAKMLTRGRRAVNFLRARMTEFGSMPVDRKDELIHALAWDLLEAAMRLLDEAECNRDREQQEPGIITVTREPAPLFSNEPASSSSAVKEEVQDWDCEELPREVETQREAGASAWDDREPLESVSGGTEVSCIKKEEEADEESQKQDDGCMPPGTVVWRISQQPPEPSASASEGDNCARERPCESSYGYRRFREKKATATTTALSSGQEEEVEEEDLALPPDLAAHTMESVIAVHPSRVDVFAALTAGGRTLGGASKHVRSAIVRRIAVTLMATGNEVTFELTRKFVLHLLKDYPHLDKGSIKPHAVMRYVRVANSRAQPQPEKGRIDPPSDEGCKEGDEIELSDDDAGGAGSEKSSAERKLRKLGNKYQPGSAKYRRAVEETRSYRQHYVQEAGIAGLLREYPVIAADPDITRQDFAATRGLSLEAFERDYETWTGRIEREGAEQLGGPKVEQIRASVGEFAPLCVLLDCFASMYSRRVQASTELLGCLINRFPDVKQPKRALDALRSRYGDDLPCLFTCGGTKRPAAAAAAAHHIAVGGVLVGAGASLPRALTTVLALHCVYDLPYAPRLDDVFGFILLACGDTAKERVPLHVRTLFNVISGGAKP